jgi:hypothetical protein
MRSSNTRGEPYVPGVPPESSNDAFFWFSSPFRGQLDGDAAAAQVDHRDQRGGRVVAVAAVVDEPDLAVEPLELRVGQAELDGGEDAVAVGADRLGQRDERRDAAPACPGQPPVEMLRRVFDAAEPEQVA